MALLGKAAILKADDLPVKDVAVPEWGGTVRVRSLTARDRDAIETLVLEMRRDGETADINVRARYAAACIVNDKGDPLFDADDVEALGRKSGAALERVYAAVVELNRIDPVEVEKAAGESQAAPI